MIKLICVENSDDISCFKFGEIYDVYAFDSLSEYSIEVGVGKFVKINQSKVESFFEFENCIFEAVEIEPLSLKDIYIGSKVTLIKNVYRKDTFEIMEAKNQIFTVSEKDLKNMRVCSDNEGWSMSFDFFEQYFSL